MADVASLLGGASGDSGGGQGVSVDSTTRATGGSASSYSEGFDVGYFKVGSGSFFGVDLDLSDPITLAVIVLLIVVAALVYWRYR